MCHTCVNTLGPLVSLSFPLSFGAHDHPYPRVGLDNHTLLCSYATGHWKLGHTPVLFTVNQVVLLVSFGLFTFIRNSQGLLDSFGFSGLGR